MASQPKNTFCGDCKKSWVRKKDYEDHFQKAQVKDGGRLVDNPCFNRKRHIRCKSLDEAALLKRTKTMDMFTKEGKFSEPNCFPKATFPPVTLE